MGQRRTGDESRSLAPDRLEAVLQASCETLIALQVIRAGAHGEVKTYAEQAIDSLRRAVVELRAASGEEPSALAHGFVTCLSPEGSSAPE
jgi:hypothetical protein